MKLKNLEKYRIILSSQSPRRKLLLSETGLEFEVIVKNSEEEPFPESLPCKDVAMFLAQQKAEVWLGQLQENDLVITADTIVVINNEVINKPKDRSDAIVMLQKLSGNIHKVITGVCLLSKNKTVLFESISSVFFRELSLAEIEHYVDMYKPFDKAGSYGIQEWIGYVGIERIEGCFFNVMGLPVQKLWEELKRF